MSWHEVGKGKRATVVGPSGHPTAVRETLSEHLVKQLNAGTNSLGEVEVGLGSVQGNFVPEKGNKDTLETYGNIVIEEGSNLLSICDETNKDLFIIEATLRGRPVKVLVDSGAKGNL